MKVFVIHYKKLTDRKKNILLQFEKYDITDYEFVEIDRDELDNYDTTIFEPNTNLNNNSQIAISLSHFYAINEIRLKYENALIFEDYVILSDNFIYKFTEYLKQLPNDYDMLFLGDGCNLHVPSCKIVPNKYIYKKSVHPTYGEINGTGRCMDSYLVSKKCAIKLCNYINNLTYKINEPVDHWLNNAGRDNDLNVYWAEPTIATQGSANGTFTKCY
jgi:GR25 family glycosyltransferase involved in LPS biosynthesis